MNILCYGDSNTYGYKPGTEGGRYPKAITWPYLLKEKLGNKDDFAVEGLNGRTTAYDRPDGAWKNGFPYLRPCLVTHSPLDLVIFMLGTNDCNADLYLSAEDIAAGMEKLINETENTMAELEKPMPAMMIVVPAPIRPEIKGTPFEYQLDASSVEKSNEIAPLYKAIAEKHNCLFVGDTSTVEVSSIDCEHLTEKGHRQLADLIYSEIIAHNF